MLIVWHLNGCCKHNEIMATRKSLLTKNYLLKQWIWRKFLAIFKINLLLFGIVERAKRVAQQSVFQTAMALAWLFKQGKWFGAGIGKQRVDIVGKVEKALVH